VIRIGELAFIGLGLCGCDYLSIKALRYLKNADHIFLETYTSILPNFSREKLEKLLGKRIIEIKRRDLEEKEGEDIIRLATRKRVALITPGDPFIATTHNFLRLKALKMGIKVLTIFGVSVVSAAQSATGLHCYKFGRVCTLVIPEERYGYFPETPYIVLTQNLKYGLHTLFLLDLKIEEEKYLTPQEAIDLLLKLEEKIKLKAISENTVAVVLARLGCNSQAVVCNTLKRLRKIDFGPPPYCLIIPGKLHPLEKESLILLAGAPPEIFED